MISAVPEGQTQWFCMLHGYTFRLQIDFKVCTDAHDDDDVALTKMYANLMFTVNNCSSKRPESTVNVSYYKVLRSYLQPDMSDSSAPQSSSVSTNY